MTRRYIDFKAIASQLDRRRILPDLFPLGLISGNEFLIGNIRGDKGESLRVNLTTGMWRDFASSEPGGSDLISLIAARNGINNPEAARWLLERYGNGDHVATEGASRPVQRIAVPVPDGSPDPDLTHPTHGRPSMHWIYRDAQRRILQFVARYEVTTADGKASTKVFCPFIYDGKKWQKRKHPDPQPLYGLDNLALRPDTSVVVVEGERCADAARPLCPRQVVVTWPGGANRWHKADWSAIYGRRVALWPDADRAGQKAMQGLGRALQGHCPSIKIFDVSDRPEKWDAADAVAEGWTTATFAQWAQQKLADLPVFVSAVATIPAAAETAVDRPKPNGHTLVSYYTLWTEWDLNLNGKGVPHANLDNAVAVMENDPGLKSLVWYDDFLQKPITGNPPREWTDNDEANLTLYMQRELGIFRMGVETVRHAVGIVAKRNKTHAARDWLDRLKWDGTPRINMFFVDHFGADNTVYAQKASKNFWLSMVARIYRPGCKADHMIVFEGPQGIGKSMALQVIGGEWWTEQHESIMGKDFYLVFQGKMLIEIGELDAFSRAEVAKVKQVVTNPTDRYRDPYARRAEDHPRQCIFVGTTNRDDWNKDETGGRRFLPVACEETIDVSAIAANREQCFAEAVHRLAPQTGWDPTKSHFLGGEDWWSMPAEETVAEQRKRRQPDPWLRAIENHIRCKPQTTTEEILTECIEIQLAKQTKADEMRATACLRDLGWKGKSQRDGKHVHRVWRPTNEQD